MILEDAHKTGIRYIKMLRARNMTLVITLLLSAVVLEEGTMESNVPASVILYSQFHHLPFRLLHLCTFASLFLSLSTTETSQSLQSQPHHLNEYSQRPSYTIDPVEDSDGDLPNDPYMSYLLWPHFHFSGTFRADVSTVNNRFHKYDTEHFVPEDLLQIGHNWNPKGSHEWSVTGFVTNVCYANGTCVGDDDKDKAAEPLVGTPIQDGSNKTAAKMVSLDTAAQLFSQIYGWRIKIGNLFSAEFTPVPYQYEWAELNVSDGYPPNHGGIYQSVLTNIRWTDTEKNSPFIKQLQNTMKNNNIDSDKLSIRFNVVLYEKNLFTSANFTLGRISGTIGLLGRKSPWFFTYGRMMNSLVTHLQSAPFYVDQSFKKVFIDFGNSLPLNRDGTLATSLYYQNLLVALHLDKDASLTCSDNMLWLGMVNDKLTNWYLNKAGVQVFPARGALSDDEMEKLSNHPLVVVEASGTWPSLKCSKILLAEARDGIDIHPYNNWVFRKNPGEIGHVQLFATKFGKPFPGALVKVEPCNCHTFFGGDLVGAPMVGQPPLPVPSHVITNENGIATLFIEANDPKNNRSFVDGQVYPFMYSIESQNKSCSNICEKNVLMLLDTVFVFLVFDQYKPKGLEPTWLDDIYPIFKQYANLYPVMTENFLDLGNYYDVVNKRRIIKMTMELPVSHPNYMPVTRDLSKSKREVILKWLSNDELPIGEPKKYYSVENLRKDLQTALQVEYSTIPIYHTALASIKKGYNLQIHAVIKNILIQEMMHLSLVANILNAVGGEPSLYSNDFFTRYPSRLPGGLHPDLVVPMEKLSLSLIRNIFMKIEQPELEQERISSFQHAFEFVHQKRGMEGNVDSQNSENGERYKREIPIVRDSSVTDPLVDESRSSACFNSFSKEQFLKDFKLRELAKIRQKVDPINDLPEGENQEKKRKRRYFPGDDAELIKHHYTIGGFYNHILNAVGYLTDCGTDNSIFTGDKSRQVEYNGWSVHGHTMKVYDYYTAVEAIKNIIEQGEGSSPCNPVSWNTGSQESLSHYFLFYSVVERHQINVVEQEMPTEGNVDDSMVDYSQFCRGTYYFNGSKIPFDPEGVWPMVSNPKMSNYKKGSKVYNQAQLFNKVFTKLVKSLHNVFNGHPETLNDTIGLMYSVNLHLKNLVRMPIDDNGDPYVGPNAGPTFDFTP